jgi:hypothetical protein
MSNNKYQHGKIYKISSSQTDKIYVGSTYQQLCQRISNHRRNYRDWLVDGKNFISSYEILKYPDAKIILIEKYPCNDKDELHAREEYHRLQNKDICVNIVACFQTYEEKKEKWKKYAEEHRDQIVNYKKELYNKQKLTDEYQQKVKKYREENKDKRVDYMKQYNQENKEKMKLRNQEKYTCEICNVELTKIKKNRHETSQMHQNNLINK